jgi:hypothetical protein
LPDTLKPSHMTDFAIKEQVETIKKATAKAVQSKESALRFLVAAGIEDATAKSQNSNKKKK